MILKKYKEEIEKAKTFFFGVGQGEGGEKGDSQKPLARYIKKKQRFDKSNAKRKSSCYNPETHT